MSEQNQPSVPNEEQNALDSIEHAEPIPSSAPSMEKKKNILKEVVDYLELFVFAICAVILLFSFVFRLCTVDGESMENTLFEEENLLVSDLFYTPERGDIVVFHQTGSLNEPVVKRVIATAGEHISITYGLDTMTVTVTDRNGKTTILTEPYMKYDTSRQSPYSSMSVTVPEGMLFVMGDNRNNSLDSRSSAIGLVDERRVLGRVIFRVTPFDRFGSVE